MNSRDNFPLVVRPVALFGLNATNEYASKVALSIDKTLTPHTEKVFEDGEFYVKSGLDDDSGVGNVRGHMVFVIQSLYTDEHESVADKFLKLCMFCGSLKDASAAEIVAVIPHLGWARQDRKTESRAPIMTKYVARMLESVGVNRCLLFDVHNLSAEQNAFNIPIDNLEGKNLFANWFAEQLIKDKKTSNIKILSPDSSGLGRCTRFRDALLKQLCEKGVDIDDIDIVVFDKVRQKGSVTGSRIIGDVTGANVIAYDDMISTGSTMAKSCISVKEFGGEVYAICSTHGIFCGKANEVMRKIGCKIVVADTIRPFRLDSDNLKNLYVVDTTVMVGKAIDRIHSGIGSLSELLKI